jgi:hypothetical protein
MLVESLVSSYPWRESANRANLAFIELRRASAVQRECFGLYWACRDDVLRTNLSARLEESQRAWQLASQEYTAALGAHVASFRASFAASGTAVLK